MKAFRVLSAMVLLAFVLGQVIACAPTPSPTAAPEATPAVAAEATPTPLPEASPTPVPEVTPAPPATFVGLVRNHPRTLDPAIGTDFPHWKFYVGPYEPLIDMKPGTMEMEPCLATSWEASEDGTVYTFKLREGVKFHDGTTLDAEDVKVSIERIKEINLGSAWALADVKEVRVVDPLTVEIVLDKPSVPFVYGMPMFYIVSAEAVKEHEKEGDLAQGWLTEHEAGTGPYMLKSWTLGEELVLTKFDDYWGGWEGKHVDRVITRLVEEAATQAIMLEGGEGHWGDSISHEDAEKMAKDPRFTVLFEPSMSLMWFMMDTTQPPLDNVKLRRAIRYAFDYKTMVEDAMRGHADLAWGYMLSIFPEHDSTLPKEHQDLEKAKELLAEAGYPGGGGLELDLIYFAPLEWERKGAELLQSNLAELGITLHITGEPWATMIEKGKNPDLKPDIIMWTASGDTVSPDSGFSKTWWSKSTHWSNYGYSNPEVDRLIEAAKVEFDEAKRTELYHQLQWLLEEDSPCINAFNTHWCQVFTSNLKGYIQIPLRYAIIDYYLVYFE